MTIALRYAARSDVGLLRDGNEDSMYAGPRLLAIADGMGGHVAGEVASSVVIATLAHLDEDLPGSDLLAALAGAARAANDHLREMASADRQLEGMGTTLTAMLVDRGRVGLVHIGDSRGYLLRDGELHRITHDHSLVQSLVDEGRISEEEAAHHPQRSLILRALDGRDDIDPDLSVRELRIGDRYLLCTDGLTDVVSESTVTETLAGADGPDEAVERLVDLALRGGGPDNITCIVADVVEDAGTHEVLVAGAAADGDGRGDITPDTPAGRAALAARRHDGGRATTDAHDGNDADHGRAGTRRRGRSLLGRRRAAPGRRTIVATGIVLLAVVAALVGTWVYVRAQYYVGASGSQVAVLRGVSGSFLGVPLHSVHSRTDIPIDQLPQYERERIEEGINAASLPAAERIVVRLRDEQGCGSSPLQPPGNLPLPSASSTSAASSTTTAPTPSTTASAGTTSTTPSQDACAGAGP
ncbi:MAG: PP2C family protein-serine/threonine phosphatase [Frankiaceae bacterium]